MRRQLVLVAVCGVCAFLGGAAAEAFLSTRAPRPLNPVRRFRRCRTTSAEKAAAPPDRFQAVIKQVGPSVVAVDAVKPPAARFDQEASRSRSPAPA